MTERTLLVQCGNPSQGRPYCNHRVLINKKGQIVLKDHNETKEKIAAAFERETWHNQCDTFRSNIKFRNLAPDYVPKQTWEAFKREISSKVEKRALLSLYWKKPSKDPVISLALSQYNWSIAQGELVNRRDINFDVMKTNRGFRVQLMAARAIANSLRNQDVASGMGKVRAIEIQNTGSHLLGTKVQLGWSVKVVVNLFMWAHNVLAYYKTAVTSEGYFIARRMPERHGGAWVVDGKGLRNAFIYKGYSGALRTELV